MELTVVGMSSVFVVLIFFAGLIWFMKFIDAKVTENKIKKTVPKFKETTQSNIDDENDLVAVITAAVYTAINKKAKVRHIQFLGHTNQDGKWANAGRLNVMSSHNLNKRN